MLVCPKCSKTFEDGSKICRDCGAILDTLELPSIEVDQEAEIQDSPSAEESFWDVIANQTKPSRSDWNQPPWECPNCKETIEANFDACWNCGTNREAAVNSTFVSQSCEPREQQSVPSPHYQIPLGKSCPKCGSSRVIPNAVLRDQGQYSDGKLKAQVIGNPEAWIFKDIEHSDLMADICGDCGYVELRVTNPVRLYEHYLQSLEKSRREDVD